MAEYIDRYKLLRDIEHYHVSDGKMQHWVEIQPTVDAVPVRHGRWETSEDDYYGLYIIKCSLCREVWCFECDDDVFDLNYHYCPNCGAKMDGDEDG